MVCRREFRRPSKDPVEARSSRSAGYSTQLRGRAARRSVLECGALVTPVNASPPTPWRTVWFSPRLTDRLSVSAGDHRPRAERSNRGDDWWTFPLLLGAITGMVWALAIGVIASFHSPARGLHEVSGVGEPPVLPGLATTIGRRDTGDQGAEAPCATHPTRRLRMIVTRSSNARSSRNTL